MELWGRKWNLVIRGVKGVDKELPKVTQVCVRLFLNQQLGFDPEHVNRMLFTAVHRLPSGPDGKKKYNAQTI